MSLIKILNYVFGIGSLFMLFIAFDCNREPIKKNNDGTDTIDTGVTITLWNKSLSVIQTYIKGRWKLQYTKGGYVGGIMFDKYNSYMILTSDSITIGNDLFGIYVNAAIIWVRDKSYFIREPDMLKDSTFLLCFTHYKYSGIPYPERNIVYAIKNDTLIIINDVADGFEYYYLK